MPRQQSTYTRVRKSGATSSLRARLRRLNLYGLLAHAEEILAEPWLAQVLEIEENERQSRSLKRRLGNARLGSFKPMADFDYSWPTELDRPLLDEVFTFAFLEHCANVVIVGPNGLGKTMIAKNLLNQTILRGLSARFTALVCTGTPRTIIRSFLCGKERQ